MLAGAFASRRCYATGVMGVSLTTSMPAGPRGWDLSFVKTATTDVEVAASLLCASVRARILRAPRLTVSTGIATVAVPAGAVVGTAFVPGTAIVLHPPRHQERD